MVPFKFLLSCAGFLLFGFVWFFKSLREERELTKASLSTVTTAWHAQDQCPGHVLHVPMEATALNCQVSLTVQWSVEGSLSGSAFGAF